MYSKLNALCELLTLARKPVKVNWINKYGWELKELKQKTSFEGTFLLHQTQLKRYISQSFLSKLRQYCNALWTDHGIIFLSLRFCLYTQWPCTRCHSREDIKTRWREDAESSLWIGQGKGKSKFVGPGHCTSSFCTSPTSNSSAESEVRYEQDRDENPAYEWVISFHIFTQK